MYLCFFTKRFSPSVLIPEMVRSDYVTPRSVLCHELAASLDKVGLRWSDLDAGWSRSSSLYRWTTRFSIRSIETNFKSKANDIDLIGDTYTRKQQDNYGVCSAGSVLSIPIQVYVSYSYAPSLSPVLVMPPLPPPPFPSYASLS